MDSVSATGSRRRPGLTGRAAILLLVLAALTVSYASSLKAWTEQRSRIDELRTELADRGRQVAEYERQIERWRDPAYIEARARKRFGWVMPGEVGYVVVGGEPGAGGQNQTGGSGEDEPARPSWWQALWGSVERADSPPEPKPDSERPEPADQIGPDSADE